VLAAVRRVALDVEALLLPLSCLACREPLASRRDEPLCDPCRHRLRALAPPRCARCAQTLDRWELEADDRPDDVPPACGFCRSWPEALAWADSACWFDDGPARALVHALKYDGWRAAAAPMGSLMARRLAPRLRGVDCLVPIPLGRRRRRERGHNQAEEIARDIGRRLGIPVAPTLLARTRETRTQTALHPGERRANVAGAFGTAGVRAGARVALVDDVLTTGATLAAAAQALSAAGAGAVGAVTFARAPKPA